MAIEREGNAEFSDFLRNLKQKSDIVEVIRSYVALDKRYPEGNLQARFAHGKTRSKQAHCIHQ